MCGIFAIARRRSSRDALTTEEILAPLRPLETGLATGTWDATGALRDAAGRLEQVDQLLRGAVGVAALLRNPGLGAEIERILVQLQHEVDGLDREFDDTTGVVPNEETNAQLLRVKDALWALKRDRIRTAREVGDLTGPNPSDAAISGFTSVQETLSALDRLEVRGRDSAGLHLFVFDHGIDLENSVMARVIEQRSNDPLFRSGSVRLVDNVLSFAYKEAAEIGELGDNTSALRAAIRNDELLQGILSETEANVMVLSHTRWASVGIISEANAHPLNSDQEGRDLPYVVGALNGDVDNHADLKAEANLEIPAAITTDAKVIPTLVSEYLAKGETAAEAFRRTCASFQGSVAIGAATAADPGKLHLALRGSGQALYVGLADDAFIVASEPYGVIELTSRYVRLDGETPANPDNPTASRGQIVTLDIESAGELAGIERVSYDGTVLPVGLGEVIEAQITTRDIDRADFPHYLLKEISESPRSFRKTLRGKLLERDGQLRVELPTETLPEDIRDRLRSGQIRRVLGIAQGTAAIAASSFARALRHQVDPFRLQVDSLPATELSGFELDDRMDDTLVVAVSQSGTTTDTNRTVDLVRARGGSVIAIVNRRGSDLTDKADGVLYTSDGRDVEMSVASTKAFYAQVAAGFLLATAIAEDVGIDQATADTQRLLGGLQALPDAMEELLADRSVIGDIATRLAPSRRYWAMVGNGPNLIAAEEIRIKLSELCYKSIACDATEDKKHIDLSSEPLILVCAAGLRGSTADDVAKEVAIFRAHKASPIVIADQGERRFADAVDVIPVPPVEPELGFILSTMAGHLFGYEAAMAIDEQASPLRRLRAAIEAEIAKDPDGSGAVVLDAVHDDVVRSSNEYFDAMRASKLNGHLEASTATRLALMLRYAQGVTQLDTYQLDFGKVGTPGVVVDDLMTALTEAIDELTRPIDAIKHQAKTVTVGISRTDETLLQVPFVSEVLDAGSARDSFSYETLRTLADLDPAIVEVTGYTRYRIEGDPTDDGAVISVVERGGIAGQIVSRVDKDPALRGTKHRVAVERQVLITKGRRDGRTIVIIPEVKDTQAVGLTLMHVRFADTLAPGVARGVLVGYQNRYSTLRDAVLETEPTFRDAVLGEIPIVDLLLEPEQALADTWRT